MRTRLDFSKCVIVFILVVFSFLAIYPFYYVIIGSFSKGADYSSSVWLLPYKPTFASYLSVLKDSSLWVALRNTLLVTIFGTMIALAVTSAVAFAVSMHDLPYKNFIMKYFLFTMFFGGGLVPYFLLIVAIGLYDSFLVYIIPSCFSVYNMIIMSNFFKKIPYEMCESALIDGANYFQIFLYLYLPCSTAVLVTVGLWVGVGYWNSYMTCLLYTKNPQLRTLQYYLIRLIKEKSFSSESMNLMDEMVSSQTITYAAVVLSTVPILCVYPFMQKHFTKGVFLGSVKG